MEIEFDLNLDIGWRIGEEAFATIVRRLREIEPQRVLEFGSGASSVRLAQAFPEAEIVAVDHDLEFLNETRAFASQAKAENIRLVHAPLRSLQIGRRRYVTYSYQMDGAVDAVVIDGPPSWTRRGREAALYLAVRQIRTGGIVFLDDADREDERKTLRNWLRLYKGGFIARHHNVGHGVAELEKQRDVDPRESTLVLADNTFVRVAMSLPFRVGMRIEKALRLATRV